MKPQSSLANTQSSGPDLCVKSGFIVELSLERCSQRAKSLDLTIARGPKLNNPTLGFVKMHSQRLTPADPDDEPRKSVLSLESKDPR